MVKRNFGVDKILQRILRITKAHKDCLPGSFALCGQEKSLNSTILCRLLKFIIPEMMIIIIVGGANDKDFLHIIHSKSA